MKNKIVLRFLVVFLISVLLSACSATDGTGSVSGEISIDGITYSFAIFDSLHDNKITLLPDLNKINCWGQIYHFVPQVRELKTTIRAYDLPFYAEGFCFMLQHGNVFTKQ